MKATRALGHTGTGRRRAASALFGRAASAEGRGRWRRHAFRFPASTLAGRIAILVVIAVLGQATILGLYLFSAQVQGKRDALAARVAELHRSTYEAERALNELGRLRRVEVPVKGEDALDAIDETAEIAHARLEALQVASRHQEIAFLGAARAVSNIDLLTDILVSYAFETHDLGVDERSGLRGELRAAALSAEELLAGIETSAATSPGGGVEDVLRVQRGMLTLRRHEKDYILHGDLATYGPRHAAQLGSTRELIERGPFDPNARQALLERLVAYENRFLAYADLRKARARTSARLDDAFAKTIASLGEAQTFLAERSREWQAKALSSRVELRRQMVILSALSAFSLLVISALLARSITRPMRVQAGVMDALSSGDLNAAIPGQGRRDEIGRIARSLLVFRDNAREAARLREAETVREADAEAERRRATRALADDLDGAVSGVVQAVQDTAARLRDTAQGLTATVQAAGTQASVVASAAGQTHDSVNTVAAAAEELSRSIEEISAQAQRSSSVMGDAVDQARTADAGVAELTRAGRSIAEVVDLISSIAEQTNLLALNATIEASRAGEAGRGFTVVASEVKALAGQTARATQDIAARIKTMQDATAGALTAIRAIHGTVGEVDAIAHDIAAAVEEQEVTTRSISHNMQDAAAGTEAVSSQVAGIDEGTRETRTSADAVMSAADNLAEQASALRERLTETLTRLRAA